MLYRLRQRAQDESGFTLIELLVVILIIGILAAIAIPAFLSQKSKAVDSGAKTMVSTAETTAETYATDHSGTYTGMSTTELNKYEPTLSLTCGSTAKEACLKTVSVPSAEEYTVTTEAPNGATFSITRKTNGEISRTCNTTAETTHGGCVSGSWNS